MKRHEMRLPSFVTPEGEKEQKRYVNIKLHIPVHRITAYQLIYEVGMKNMSDKTSEQNY